MGCWCHLEKQGNITDVIIKPSGSGVKTGKSDTLLTLVDNEDMKSQMSKNTPHRRKQTSAIAESVPQNKRTTSAAKSKRCGPSFQTTGLSPTLEAESTGKGKAFEPFWNQQCSEIAETLWLPTETDSPVSGSNSSNGSFITEEPTSWFNVKKWMPHQRPSSLRISSPSLPSLLANITGNADTKKSSTLTAKKIRIFPNPRDSMVLKRWCGLYRRMYNLAVDRMLKTGNYHSKGHKVLTTYENIPKKTMVQLLPTRIRKEAYREASTAFGKAIRKTNVKYKTLKSCGRSLRVEAGGMRLSDDGKRLFITDNKTHKQLSKDGIQINENDLKNININKMAQIVYENGSFWLITTHEVSITSNTRKSQVVALDPGVRTFQTTYSPDGNSHKLGDQASCRIFRLLRHVDKLSVNKTKRTRGKRLRLEQKITNLVTELHWKTAKHLVDNYDTIIIPPFETQKLAKKWNNDRYRKLNKTAVRMMLRLSHYRFRERLIHMANKYGSRVVIWTEEYTSKTCGHCGEINHDLGSSKVFNCPQCHIHLDRDGNGARNICIKALCKC